MERKTFPSLSPLFCFSISFRFWQTQNVLLSKRFFVKIIVFILLFLLVQIEMIWFEKRKKNWNFIFSIFNKQAVYVDSVMESFIVWVCVDFYSHTNSVLRQFFRFFPFKAGNANSSLFLSFLFGINWLRIDPFFLNDHFLTTPITHSLTSSPLKETEEKR